MPSYNGLVGSTATQTLYFAASTSYTNVVPQVPAKWFHSGVMAVKTYGLSGALGLEVVGAVGGATFVIAGTSAIGSSDVVLTTRAAYPWGFSTTSLSGHYGFPRPAYIQWQPGADGTSFSAAVFVAGNY